MEICGSLVVVNPYLILRNACLAVENGKITSLTSYRDDVSEEFTIVSHGLASLHTHLGLYPIRSTLYFSTSLDSWVTKYAWPWERLLRTELNLSYYSALLALDELVRSGVTAVADMHFNEEVVARAIERVGIRGDLSTALMNRGVFDSFEEAIEENLRLVRALKGKSNMNVRLGPCTPRLLTPSQVKYVIKLAAELGVGIHMHVGEVPEDAEYLQKSFGLSMSEFLNYTKLGMVDSIVAHGIWLFDGLEALKRKPVVIAHSPRSNILLGSGLTSLRKVIAEGVDAALALDVAPTYNILDELGVVLYTQRLEGVDVHDLYSMVTQAPYKSMGFGTGCLINNEPADVVIWELEDNIENEFRSILSSASQPPINLIIYALVSGHAKVRDLYVGGRAVIKGGRPAIPLSEIDKAREKVHQAIRDLYGGSVSL
ncbi:MAG: amidohydrolase family protein [Desulfurococcales archaeon]|nr:amidohydrolase family protein [Desulfurococcales archaeon]